MVGRKNMGPQEEGVYHMRYEIIEVEHGKNKIIKGYFIQNAGKNNGLLVRRNQTPHLGKPVDNLEIWMIFLAKPRGKKPARWMVQCKHTDYPSSYGYPQWVKFPPATLFSILECLKQVYSEIFGDNEEEDVLSETVDVYQGEPPPAKVKPKDKKMMEDLKKLGF